MGAALLLAGCGAGANGPGAPTPGATSASSMPAVSGTPQTASSSPTTAPTPGEISATAGDPADLTVPESASGRTRVVPVPGADTPAAEAPGHVVRYTAEVEEGLEEIAAGFPAAVRADLTDARGWQKKDGVRFVNVSPSRHEAGVRPDIRIQFASPRLVDEVCAPMRTGGRLSCHHHGKVMINAWRWVHGAPTYGDDLANYRIYLVNHEVGHAIGHSHRSCPGKGAEAPVMLQQTLRLEGCRPHPYPVPGAR
ncbi:hypothetical protein MOPEL_007_00090 [Mobilicoccus pelagius NBRC 104925]|uniref:DUF3152 domain-containing protein n=1 Tax=Mobilicoccus pelagius NBRC 104925 TaxID=1089455 RepID=H5UN84_9MICO|nr:hypothetical protein MOPEL_007_00090 [Mobilicoccus pelagius NBRC 104925]